MKILALIRHAESDWPEEISDFNRPLSEKGRAEAQQMASFLKKLIPKIDLFVASPALRTKSTCAIFNEAYQTEVIERQEIYNPTDRNFLSAIYQLNDEVEAVAFFSHNNGISNFANSLTGEMSVHFPTCGVAVFQIDTNSWQAFDGASKKRLHFLAPKQLPA